MDTATTAQSETLALAGSVAASETEKPRGTCELSPQPHTFWFGNCRSWKPVDPPAVSVPPRGWHECLANQCLLYAPHSHVRLRDPEVDQIRWDDGSITERPPTINALNDWLNSHPLPTGKALLEAWGEVEDRLRDNPPTNPLNTPGSPDNPFRVSYRDMPWPPPSAEMSMGGTISTNVQGWPLPVTTAPVDPGPDIEQMTTRVDTFPPRDRIQFSMDADLQEYTTRPFIQRILNDYHAIRAAGHAHEEALDLLRLAYPV